MNLPLIDLNNTKLPFSKYILNMLLQEPGFGNGKCVGCCVGADSSLCLPHDIEIAQVRPRCDDSDAARLERTEDFSGALDAVGEEEDPEVGKGVRECVI